MNISSRAVTSSLVLLMIAAGAVGVWIAETSSQHARPPGVVVDYASCVAAGNAIMESYPEQCGTPDGRLFTRDVGNAVEKQDEIHVTMPQPGERVASPLTIQGAARGTWYFEASFPVKLEAADGTVLATGIAQATKDWTTQDFLPFTAMLTWTGGTATSGRIVLAKDNPSGLTQNDDALYVPVRIASSSVAAQMDVRVYFATATTGSAADLDCRAVAPVTRVIARTIAPARAALESLLTGPTPDDVAQGYNTAINAGVTIDSLTIADRVAHVDLSKRVEQGVGGSCRVATIRAQIERTLEQFDTVDSVVISVEGRVDDALQP